MRVLKLRAVLCAVPLISVLFVVAHQGYPAAQMSTRRAVSLAALFAFPGFYQGQPVVVRGMLVTRDQAVLISRTVDRSIPLIFNGPSPIDGPVEIRATFWDVGRLQRDDPRIQTLGLDRLLPSHGEGDWPRPGAVCALIVTDAMSVKQAEGAPTLRLIALDPATYLGQRVKIAGQFRGRNLYGDLPQGPGLSQWDFVLRAADASIWVTGLRPRGKGFNLNVQARVDTGNWLEAMGIVREGNGLIWIEAQLLALAKPDLETRNAETSPAQLMGAPPEVIFSDPEEGELDVSLKAVVRLQFSRDMNPESFKGHLRWNYVAPDAVAIGPSASTDPARQPQYRYDGAKRSLEIRLDSDELSRYRDVVVELLDGIAATDGAKLKPWKLTFSFGGQ
jgi:Big-like domain-containing protein